VTDEHQLASINVNDRKLKRKLSFAEILAIVLISGQIVLYSFMWLRLLGNPILKTMDFLSFYGTGRLIRGGEYKQIYNLEAQVIAQRQVVGAGYSFPLIFAHPPYVTPLLALIASDNYVLAYIYWTVAGLLVLGACTELIRCFLLRLGWDTGSAWLGAMGCVIFFPVFISLLDGQDTVYTLIGLLVWMFALLKGDEMFAGIGLAFATLSPIIAGALAVPMFASRRHASSWFIAGNFGLAIYSFLLIGFQGVVDLLHLLNINSQGGVYGLNWSVMYNLLGLLIRDFPGLRIETIHSIVWIAAVLSITSMCIFWWNRGDDVNIKHIGIAVLLGTFTAPHLYLHGLSYLLLPLLGMVIILHDRGNTSFALILIPAVSSLLVMIMFLMPAWNFAVYYLLMLAMLLGFIMLKPPAMPRKNLSV